MGIKLEKFLNDFEEQIKRIKKDYDIDNADISEIIFEIIDSSLPIYYSNINEFFIENISEIDNDELTFTGGISIQEDITRVVYDFLSNKCWSLATEKYPELI